MGLVALIVLTAGWLVILAALVLDFAGVLRRRGGASWRWMAVGLLVSDSSGLVNTFARVRGWSYGRELALDRVTLLVTLTGAVIAVAGAVVGGRERGRARRGGNSAG